MAIRLVGRSIPLLWCGLALVASVSATAQGTRPRVVQPRPGAPGTRPGMPAPRPGSPPMRAPQAPGAPAPGQPAAIDPLAARAELRVSPVTKRVMAFYYPWYATKDQSGKWAHYDGVDEQSKTIATHAHFPTLGAYDSNDPAVIKAHLQQARDAGIDTLICSWWGAKDPTDKAIRALLEGAPQYNVNISVLWEQVGDKRDLPSATAELSYLIDIFTRQPAYLKEGGRPVIFGSGQLCRTLSPTEWATLLVDVEKRYAPGVRILGDGSQLFDLLVWDGIYNLGHMTLMGAKVPAECASILRSQYWAQNRLSGEHGRIRTVTLSPGHDDQRHNRRVGIRGSLLVERYNGALYSALWEQALKDVPDWVLINSFNQWHSGTEIESSVEHADRYLKLTKEFATRFKGASVARQ